MCDVAMETETETETAQRGAFRAVPGAEHFSALIRHHAPQSCHCPESVVTHRAHPRLPGELTPLIIGRPNHISEQRLGEVVNR